MSNSVSIKLVDPIEGYIFYSFFFVLIFEFYLSFELCFFTFLEFRKKAFEELYLCLDNCVKRLDEKNKELDALFEAKEIELDACDMNARIKGNFFIPFI